jgi:hypothetical protein
MCRGGMLIKSRRISPRAVAWSASQIASMCQFGTNTVAGSTTSQAAPTKERRLDC